MEDLTRDSVYGTLVEIFLKNSYDPICDIPSHYELRLCILLSCVYFCCTFPLEHARGPHVAWRRRRAHSFWNHERLIGSRDLDGSWSLAWRQFASFAWCNELNIVAASHAAISLAHFG